MAEKEERILIKKEINYHPPYGGWRGDGKEIVLTRQEAINRMAKALYLFNREDEWYKEHADMYSKYMNKMAEAALNALLEVEK